MKKAGIFLTAIAVFAVVGGVMAFKAKKSITNFYCCNPFNPLVCDVPIPAQSTIDDSGNGIWVSCSLTPTFCDNNHCRIALKPTI